MQTDFKASPVFFPKRNTQINAKQKEKTMKLKKLGS